jgi:hypothetical protein
MPFWDIFSGESGRNMAIWAGNNTNAGAQQQRDYINQGTDLSLGALGMGTDRARGDLTQTTLNAQDMLGHGVQGALANLSVNDRNYRGLAGQGDQYLVNAGQQADAYYQPLGAGANAGFSAYGDAAGVNGAEGQTRARQNFQTGPGYNFARDEALNAATRGANAAGMTASGNTVDALSRLGNNLANQEWGSYVNRLSPYLGLAPQIAGARAGIATNTASQRTGLGQRLADQLGQNQNNIAGLYTGYGKDLAGISQNYGNSLASMATGLGANQAGQYSDRARNLSNITGAETGTLTNLGQAGFNAGQQANANTWNAGMQVANLAADMFGKVKNPFG